MRVTTRACVLKVVVAIAAELPTAVVMVVLFRVPPDDTALLPVLLVAAEELPLSTFWMVESDPPIWSVLVNVPVELRVMSLTWSLVVPSTSTVTEVLLALARSSAVVAESASAVVIMVSSWFPVEETELLPVYVVAVTLTFLTVAP